MKRSSVLLAAICCAGLVLVVRARDVAAHDIPAAPDGMDWINNIPGGGNDAFFDHLKCFKVKDARLPVNHVLDFIPHENVTFPAFAGCKFGPRALTMCIDVAKQNVVPPPANPTDIAFPPLPPAPPADDGTPGNGTEVPNAWDYLCYKIKCPVPTPAITTFNVTDQFASGPVTVVMKAFRLCAPILDKPVF
jgi:hypothetical protein